MRGCSPPHTLASSISESPVLTCWKAALASILDNFQVAKKYAVENWLSSKTKIAAIGAPIAGHCACEIATFGVVCVCPQNFSFYSSARGIIVSNSQNAILPRKLLFRDLSLIPFVELIEKKNTRYPKVTLNYSAGR